MSSQLKSWFRWRLDGHFPRQQSGSLGGGSTAEVTLQVQQGKGEMKDGPRASEGSRL